MHSTARTTQRPTITGRSPKYINSPAALPPIQVQKLDDLQVPVLGRVVHGVVSAPFRAVLVQPLDDVEVPVESGVVHGADAASFPPVVVQPQHDVQVTVGCCPVHRLSTAPLPDKNHEHKRNGVGSLHPP